MREIHRNFQDVLADYGIAAASEMFADDYTEETMKKYDILKKLDEEEGLKAQIFSYMKLYICTVIHFTVRVDSCLFQSSGIQPHAVTVRTGKIYRSIRNRLIQKSFIRKWLISPVGDKPSGTSNSFVIRMCICKFLNDLHTFRLRTSFSQIRTHISAAINGSGKKMGMCIQKRRHDHFFSVISASVLSVVGFLICGFVM